MSEGTRDQLYIPVELKDLTAGQKLSIGGLLFTTIGIFLPWLSVSLLGSQFTLRGIEGDGGAILIGAILVGPLTIIYWNRVGQTIIGVFGFFSALIGIIYIIDPLVGVDQSQLTIGQQRIAGSAVNVRMGLYVTFLGGILTTYGGINDILNGVEKESDSISPQTTSKIKKISPQGTGKVGEILSQFEPIHAIIGAGSVVFSYIYIIVIHQIFRDYGVTETIVTFQGFVFDSWIYIAHTFAISHDLAAMLNLGIPYPINITVAISVPVIAGFLTSKHFTYRNKNKAFIGGALLFVGYSPLIIAFALLSDGLLVNNTQYYFDFPRMIFWAIIHPLILSGVGAVLWTSIFGNS